MSDTTQASGDADQRAVAGDRTRASEPLRVGVIGLGWAGETHVKSYLQTPNVEVVAWAGLEQNKLAQLGATYNVPDLYESYEDLIARDDIDAISVCAPNYLHAPIAIAALQSGKHVLCEKPLARTGAEAASIVEAAERANRVLHVAFNYRHRFDVQVLKQYIASGSVGRIYHGKASWMRRSGIPGLGSWFTNKEMAGGGPLIDLGVHVLDLALYLLDEPEVVTVSAATYGEIGQRGMGGWSDASKQMVGSSFEVEDLATAFIRLGTGSTLLLEASWATHSSAADDFGVTLYGSDGGAEIKVKNYGWEDTLRIYTNVAGTPAEIHPRLRPGEGHVPVVREFVTAIRDGNWSSSTGREGMRRAQIIDACYQSALEGREVTLGPVMQRVSSTEGI